MVSSFLSISSLHTVADTYSFVIGANDVAMILEASIGVGITGLEGGQAAMSSDFAISQFRHLNILLLKHGRWSYVRIAETMASFFYKNVVWCFASFFYQIYCGFDAAFLFEYTFVLLFSLVFTSLPVIFLGCFEQDVNSAAAIAFPRLYSKRRGIEYSPRKFWIYVIDGLYQAVICFFVPMLAFGDGQSQSPYGYIPALAEFGTTVAIAAVLCVNLCVGLNVSNGDIWGNGRFVCFALSSFAHLVTHSQSLYWTVWVWVIQILSNLSIIAWVLVYSFISKFGFKNVALHLFPTVSLWATLLITLVIALGPRFLIKFWCASYIPMDKEIIRERWVSGQLKQGQSPQTSLPDFLILTRYS